MSAGEPANVRSDVRLLFGTPVAHALLPGDEERNAALKAAILKRRATTPSLQASNLGGWQSDWGLQEWGGPAAGELLLFAKSLANSLTRSREGKPLEVPWKVNAWANMNGPGHANEFHCHPGAFWSGVYYVDDAGTGRDLSLGGELEFMDPRGPGPAMYAPRLAFAGPGGLSLGACEQIRPRAGTLLLFPAWLLHQVRPHRGQGERISIAFNLSV